MSFGVWWCSCIAVLVVSSEENQSPPVQMEMGSGQEASAFGAMTISGGAENRSGQCCSILYLELPGFSDISGRLF